MPPGRAGTPRPEPSGIAFSFLRNGARWFPAEFLTQPFFARAAMAVNSRPAMLL